MKVSNWGKYPVIDAPVKQYRSDSEVFSDSQWIPRGMGRCYGDSSLGETMLSTLKNNRFLSFDDQTGILECEAGVTFEDILTHFVPKGWFPPVTPGTKFVSMGGALASDVHGKNHHKEGSISSHVLSFSLLKANGEIINCSRSENPNIFDATLGGMGLTGLILSVKLRLKPIKSAFIDMQSVKARNLDEILSLTEEFGHNTYSMAWIDCLAGGKKMGRSILMKGEHAELSHLENTPYAKNPLTLPSKRKLTIPFDFPSFALNPLSIKAFNFLYYHKQTKAEIQSLVPYDSFFYPLDAIHHWNRIYGKRGFTQYQFVIPKESSREGLSEILKRISKAGMGSFLAVLKLFGAQEGMITFPIEGYTLALDFPVQKKLFPFLDQLDQIVVDYGGRVYLTKDVRLSPEMLQKMYPRLEEFKAILKELDPQGKIRSHQSLRLGLHSQDEA